MRVYLATLLLLTLVSACSHPLEILGQGDILSASGERTCLLEEFQSGQDNCSENYVVGDYQETYFAQAREGWRFDQWENYCTDSTNNACSFDVEAMIIELFWGDTVPPLRAVFVEETAMPVTDFVTVNNLDWVQPDLFTAFSWNDIREACPDIVYGGGACQGQLGSYDMQGWSWAGVDDVNGLFGQFLDPVTLGPGPDLYQQRDSGWAAAFFAAGFRPLTASLEPKTVAGVTRTTGSASGTARLGELSEWPLSNYFDNASTAGEVDVGSAPGYGAWFFRFTESGGATITDTVVVAGEHWAQPELFQNVTWNQLNALCPNGACNENAVLNGYVLDGWTWASVGEVNALFNTYISGMPMGSGPDQYSEFESGWAPAFFDAGFRPTVQGFNQFNAAPSVLAFQE